MNALRLVCVDRQVLSFPLAMPTLYMYASLEAGHAHVHTWVGGYVREHTHAQAYFSGPHPAT